MAKLEEFWIYGPEQTKRNNGGEDPFITRETTHLHSRVLRAMLLAALILAILNSNALVQYARSLPIDVVDETIEDQIVAAAEAWHDHLTSQRVTELISLIQTRLSGAQQANWLDVQNTLIRWRTQSLFYLNKLPGDPARHSFGEIMDWNKKPGQTTDQITGQTTVDPASR